MYALIGITCIITGSVALIYGHSAMGGLLHGVACLMMAMYEL